MIWRNNAQRTTIEKKKTCPKHFLWLYYASVKAVYSRRPYNLLNFINYDYRLHHFTAVSNIRVDLISQVAYAVLLIHSFILHADFETFTGQIHFASFHRCVQWASIGRFCISVRFCADKLSQLKTQKIMSDG